MKIEVRLIDGNHINFESPESFDLVVFVNSIRSAGMWLNQSIYVPVENIFSIHIVGQGPKFAEKVH